MYCYDKVIKIWHYYTNNSSAALYNGKKVLYVFFWNSRILAKGEIRM